MGIGEKTTTKEQIKSKTSNRNDKYFYSDYLEYFEGHLENYSELMKSRYFEFMEEDLTYKSSSLLRIKGSLKRHITYWENIGASAFILDIISSGYKIPFYLTPESSFSSNNRSAIEHSEFVRDSTEDLIANRFAIKVPFKPACVNPLTVSINKQGKKRLILDLRIPNKLIWKQRVKFEDWKYAINYFEKGSFMFKFDLKNGYFHIDISHAHQTYLGFCFDDNFYCFTILAFGLPSSPFIFTKCLRTMVKLWRENSIKIVMFIDDGFGLNKSLQKCQKQSEFVRQSLVQAGFKINNEKSIWEPQKSLEWTGLFWDGNCSSLSIPDRRISDFFSEVNYLLKKLPKTPARHLAKLVGKIISMMPVIGNIARLRTRHLYSLIHDSDSWDKVFSITHNHPAIEEIFFWKETLLNINV